MDGYEVGDRVLFTTDPELSGTEGTIIEIVVESQGLAFFVQSDMKCCPVYTTIQDVIPA